MASSTDKPDVEYGKEVPPPKPGVPPATNYFSADLALRVLLFAALLTAVVVIVTSKQTVDIIPFPGAPLKVPVPAKFNHSPAFIYFVAALSVAGLYSIITILASIAVLVKPIYATKYLLYFALFDVLMLGLVVSATGTAGGVAYVGLKGNKHTGWVKVCSNYDKFCQHLGGSLAVSLFASVVLVVLIWLSLFAIHSRIPK